MQRVQKARSKRLLHRLSLVLTMPIAFVCMGCSGSTEVGTKWSFATNGRIDSSPVVANSSLFFGSNETFHAVDINSGLALWNLTVKGNMSSASVVDGIVFFGSDDGVVYALEADSGVQKWNWSTASYISVSPRPVVVDGFVFVCVQDDKLYALDAANGTERWAFPLEGCVETPAYTDGIVVFGASDQKVYGIDAESGEEEWSFWITGHPTAPVVADGTAFFGVSLLDRSFDRGFIYALDVATGEKKWQSTTERSIRARPTLMGDTVFVSCRGKVSALDAATGSVKWSYEVEKPTELAASGDSVFFGNGKSFYAISATNGMEKWHFEATGMIVAAPTVADGTVLVGSLDKRMYALAEEPSHTTEI